MAKDKDDEEQRKKDEEEKEKLRRQLEREFREAQRNRGRKSLKGDEE